MIDEYDMRASLWPISIAIDSSAPAITAAVIGSTRVIGLARRLHSSCEG